ncbi:unnamed protein product, partial [Candidula unifasciata]
MMSSQDPPSLLSSTSTSSNYTGTPDSLPTVSSSNQTLISYYLASNPRQSHQPSFARRQGYDSTTEDEYDGDEFDDVVTPTMSSPLIKRRDGEERRGGRVKSKEEAGTVCWNVEGEDAKLVDTEINAVMNSVPTPPTKESEELTGKTDNKYDIEPPSYQHFLESNGFASPPPSAAVVSCTNGEAVSPVCTTATLASPGLQRSDSVKFCRPLNGNAQRSGYGSSVAGMAGSNPVAGVNRPARRVHSLKLKRLHVLGSRGGIGGGGGGGGGGATSGDKLISGDTCGIGIGANNTGAPTVGHVNPSITITLDSDSDSIYSDYLSPEINYKTHESKVQFLGDETSLYGTPKEELPSSSDPLTLDAFPKTSSTTSYLREQIMNFFQPSDNKLAMKLFGNKNALIKEKMRHKRVGNWVIHPCSNFR